MQLPPISRLFCSRLVRLSGAVVLGLAILGCQPAGQPSAKQQAAAKFGDLMQLVNKRNEQDASALLQTVFPDTTSIVNYLYELGHENGYSLDKEFFQSEAEHFLHIFHHPRFAQTIVDVANKRKAQLPLQEIDLRKLVKPTLYALIGEGVTRLPSEQHLALAHFMKSLFGSNSLTPEMCAALMSQDQEKLKELEDSLQVSRNLEEEFYRFNRRAIIAELNQAPAHMTLSQQDILAAATAMAERREEFAKNESTFDTPCTKVAAVYELMLELDEPHRSVLIRATMAKTTKNTAMAELAKK